MNHECEQAIRREWGADLRSCTPDELSAWDLDVATAAFLTRIGLPQVASDGANIVIDFRSAEEYEPFLQAGHPYVVIGETDTDALLLLSAADGSLSFGGDMRQPPMFANSSLATLLCCLTMYRREFVERPLSPEEESVLDPEDEEPGNQAIRERAARLRARIAAIDPQALENSTDENESLWSFVASEVEWGVV